MGITMRWHACPWGGQPTCSPGAISVGSGWCSSWTVCTQKLARGLHSRSRSNHQMVSRCMGWNNNSHYNPKRKKKGSIRELMQKHTWAFEKERNAWIQITWETWPLICSASILKLYHIDIWIGFKCWTVYISEFQKSEFIRN